MKFRIISIAIASVVILALVVFIFVNNESEITHQSKYVTQKDNTIKSLTPEDITSLKAGEGWGLARAAELNGVPGPVHILAMGHKIHLTKKQKNEVVKIYNDMKAKAIELGEELIRLEKELNDNFAKKTIDNVLLAKQIREIEKVRANLRIVHLAAHLKTPNIISDEQIALYNQLRGYSKDPCENIPPGHSAKMWKKHNNC